MIIKLQINDVNELDNILYKMAEITWKKGIECALVKTTDNEFYFLKGEEDHVTIPDEIQRKSEIIIHSHPPEEGIPTNLLSKGDLLAIHEGIDVIKKVGILSVYGNNEEWWYTLTIYTLKEEKRKELKKHLEEIMKDKDKLLETIMDIYIEKEYKERLEEIETYFETDEYTDEEIKNTLNYILGRPQIA